MTEKNTSIRTKTRHPADFLTYIAIYVCAIISVALLLGIIIYVFAKGIRSVNWEFLTSVTSVLKGTTGIAGNIVNTLYIIIVTMLIATPIGVGAAVYLNEYAKPGKLVSLIEFATETLAGIPSIIFGLFGMMFFGQTLHLKYSILTGSFTLTDGTSSDHPEYTGSVKNGSGQLPKRSDRFRRRKMAYDTHHFITIRNAGNHYRSYSSHRENCWGVSSTAVYRGKFRSPPEELYRFAGKGKNAGGNTYHSALPECNEGGIRGSIWYCSSSADYCSWH